LESEAQLPAQREEVVEALEEGIGLFDAAMLRSVRAGAAGGALRLDCVRVRLEATAARGPFQVHPIEGSEFALEADALISAIGQEADLAVLGLAGQGALLPTDARGATGWGGVWAGGDLTSMARQVSEAIAMGERAALDIVHRLSGDACAESATALPAVTLAQINLHYHPAQPRAAVRHVGVAQRLAQGGEVQLGLDHAAALLEGARCFSCGTCTHCDNCVTYCPDLAVQRTGEAYAVLTDYCKGCGLCVKECPSGSMLLQEELR
jgi:NADPH-dependent glutamate synthase beta subunit-like oxidoreductase